MGWKIATVFLSVLFLISFSSASFNYSSIGSSMNNQYGIPDHVKAKINISFQNESLNSTFMDSLGSYIQLGALLDKVIGYDYRFNDSTNKSINSAYHILEFDNANFSLPEIAGNFTYELNFSGTILFEKKFSIFSTDNSAKEQIDEDYSKLAEAKLEIKKYDLSVQKILNELLNMTSVESDLNKIKTKYESSNTNEEYAQILENLSQIKIPEEISENVNTNSITFYPDRDSINLEILKTIGGGDYGQNENAYINSIYTWNENNLITKLNFKEFLIIYGVGEETTLKIFEFKFDKTNMENTAYFIVGSLENLKFEENYSESEELGYYYINLNDISDNIVFSTTEDVNFLDVPAFISPSLGDLKPVNAEFPSVEGKFPKWLLFGLIVFLLLLIAIITYTMLQTWYRRKYENYLFKNRNNLYNIMTYIQNAKKKGMERDNIMKNLKKAGWTREQTNYAIRKYEGKKIIGIIEKPFKKVMSDLER
jgi:hypothetical protein